MQSTAPFSIGYLFCLMIGGIVLVGMHPDFGRESGPDSVQAINSVAISAFGALAGYRVYLALVHYRARNVRLAANGNLTLGVVLGWAALLLTSVTARPAVTVVSLALLLSPPVYAAGANLVFKYLKPYAAQRREAIWISKHFTFNFLATLFLISCGVLMTWSGLHWVVGLVAYIIFFFLYIILLAALESDSQQTSDPRTINRQA